ATDLLAMIVIVAVMQEVRLELQDALQVERALVEDGVELDLALLRAMDAGVAGDRLDLCLDLLELVLAREIGLVEQDHVGERDLLLRLAALLKLAEEVPGID